MLALPDDTAGRPPSSGSALALLAVATALLVGILGYSLRLSARADRHFGEINRSGTLRYRTLAVYAAGQPGHPAPARRPDWWRELRAVHDEVAGPYSALVPDEAATWAALAAEADAGPVRWETAWRYVGAADRLTAAVEGLARAEAAAADRLFALGLACLGLIGAAAGLLVARLRRTAGRLREQEANSRAFLDNSPVIAFVKDAAGRYRYVSRAGRERFGVVAGDTAAAGVSAETAALVADADRQALADGRPVTTEIAVPAADGGRDYWMITRFPLPGRGDRLVGGLAVDVTTRRRAEAARRVSEERLRLVLARLPAVVVAADPDGTVTLHDGQALAVTGRTPGSGVGRPFGEVFRADGPIHPLPFALALGGQEQLLAATVAGRAFDVHYLPVRDDDGRVVRAVAVAVDVTDREAKAQKAEQSKSELLEQARRDALTGLPNRRALDERLAEEAARAARQGTPLAVVLADVDHFKRLNDALGHPAGDRALKAVAKALRGTAREADVVARYGGEEFCVLLPNTDPAAGRVVAERLRAAVAAADFPDRPLTASFGVAGWLPGDGLPVPADLLAEADRWLYRAKANGRDRVEADPGPG